MAVSSAKAVQTFIDGFVKCEFPRQVANRLSGSCALILYSSKELIIILWTLHVHEKNSYLICFLSAILVFTSMLAKPTFGLRHVLKNTSKTTQKVMKPERLTLINCKIFCCGCIISEIRCSFFGLKV